MSAPTKKTRILGSEVDRADFIDKLAQRWIVERAAMTMYQLGVAHLEGDRKLDSLARDLERFEREESLHADMLAQLLAELGHGDVNAEPATPAVNLAASAMAAILESIRAPTATERSILEAMLMAERLEIAGWELLTDLANDASLDEEYLRSFRAAGREEREQEFVLRTHLMQLERAALVSVESPGTPPGG